MKMQKTIMVRVIYHFPNRISPIGDRFSYLFRLLLDILLAKASESVLMLTKAVQPLCQ